MIRFSRKGMAPRVFVLVALGLACGDKSEATAGVSDGMTSASATESASASVSATDTETDSASASASASATATATATETATDGTASASGSSTGDLETTGCSFLSCNDAGMMGGQCDPMGQDCPEGDKCTAVSQIEGEPWGVNICVEVGGDGGLGDPCDVEGGKYTGFDNCGVGYICLLTDDSGNAGTCVEFCDVDMLCPDSGAKCVVYNDGSLPICLANCDPLVQDCAEGQGCYPSGGETFVCFKTSVEVGEGGEGDGCNYTNQCQPGLLCLAPTAVPECGENGCCSSFCSLAEGNGVCLEGQDCLPYFDEGQAPPGYDDVGVCAIPE